MENGKINSRTQFSDENLAGRSLSRQVRRHLSHSSSENGSGDLIYFSFFPLFKSYLAGLSIPVQDATLHSPPHKTTPKGLGTTWTVMVISDAEDQDSEEIGKLVTAQLI